MSEKRLESLDLNLLVALHWLLTERNVTAAAEKTGVTQPAMSRTLGRLRDVFDDPLLVKSGAGMKRTRLAERLQPTVADAIDHCRDVFRMSDAFDPASAEGAFRIACVDYTAAMAADIWARSVRAEAPLLDLEIVNLTIDAGRDLITGKIDLVIMPDPAVMVLPAGFDIDQFVRRLVMPQKYLCALRKDHPDAAGRMTLKKYSELEHILVAPQGTRQGTVDRRLEAKGLRRRIAYLTGSFLPALSILQKTDCVITAPEGLLMLDEANIVTFPPPVTLNDLDLFAGWHPNWTNDARHQWVRGRLFEGFEQKFPK